MEKQFVTYKVALKLKELGFKEECFTEYDDKGTLLINYPHECFYDYCNINEYEGIKETKNILAPLWQQAIKWCLDKIDRNDVSVIYSKDEIYISVFLYGQEQYMHDSKNIEEIVLLLIDTIKTGKI